MQVIKVLIPLNTHQMATTLALRLFTHRFGTTEDLRDYVLIELRFILELIRECIHLHRLNNCVLLIWRL